MNSPSLFEQKSYLSIIRRIQNLSPDATNVSSEMTIKQTLVHCQKPLLLSLEDPEVVIPDTNDFEELKMILIELVELFYQQTPRKKWTHPNFGDFTQEQWGHSQFKHLDHHLSQFNA